MSLLSLSQTFQNNRKKFEKNVQKRNLENFLWFFNCTWLHKTPKESEKVKTVQSYKETRSSPSRAGATKLLCKNALAIKKQRRAQKTYFIIVIQRKNYFFTWYTSRRIPRNDGIFLNDKNQLNDRNSSSDCVAYKFLLSHTVYF